MSLSRRARQDLAALAFAAVTCVPTLPTAASAAVYHVMFGGTRIAGPSVPSDWTPPNCYSDLALAAVNAASADSVLLYDEDHAVVQTVEVPAFLGNPRLDDDHSTCRIVLGADGRLLVDPASLRFEARGVTITESASASDKAAFLVNDPGGSLLSVAFTDCLFLGNRGSNVAIPGGSCLTALSVPGPTALTFTRCEIDSNSTVGPGGALHVGDGYDLLLEETTLRGNVSFPDPWGGSAMGGAIAVKSPTSSTSVTLVDCLFSGNQAWGPGGALYLSDCDITLLRCEVSDSRSGIDADFDAGAGVHALLTTTHSQTRFFTADSCVFLRNTQDLASGGELAGDGGGVLVRGDMGEVVDVSVSDCLFESNFAAQGAGLYVGRYADGIVRRCRFLHNRSQLQGGATYKGGALPENEGETAVYEYCEFIGNEAGLTEAGEESLSLGRGGAFSTRTYPRAEFYNCTFVENVAHGPLHRGDAIFQNDDAGSLNVSTRQCELHNCVFYGGGGGNDTQIFSRPNGFSIVEYCAWEPGEFVSGGVVPVETVDLLASPFESLSDPRPFFGSPLVDAGTDVGLTIDIEGDPVPNGPYPDIGAYEGLSSVSAPAALAASEPALESWPNPFGGMMTVAYDLSRTGFVELEIFDVAGRRVTVLDRGVHGPGRQEARWTGRDASGHEVSSGVYCVRLRAGARDVTRKVVLTRRP